MSNLNKRPVRRAAAGVLAGTLALTGGALVAGVSPASADEGFDLRRVAGDNRYQTSADIAAEFGESSSAILASGEAGRFADALSANFLAGVQGAPVLLTQRATTPQVILDALEDAGVTDITLVGGTDVISLAQEMALEADGYTVTRLGGVDRFATSQLVINAGDDADGDISNIGVIASGINFPDALSVGSLSYAGNHPLGLVRANLVPDETLEALEDAGVDSVLLIGGTAVVGTEVEDQLEEAGIEVLDRLDGVDRSGTSVAVAEYLLTRPEFTNTTFNVASGAQALDGVDALGGAALSGEQGRALLITNTATAAGEVDDFAADHIDTLDEEGLVFGGTNAVSQAVVDAIVDAGDDVPEVDSNQTFTVTPAGASSFEGDADAADADDRNVNARTYTVDVGDATNVAIALANPDNVDVDANGVVTFERLGSIADFGDTGGVFINRINSTDVATDRATSVTPVNGQVTFRVNGNVDGFGTAIPVVYVPTAGNLPVDTDGAPTADFGIGGQVTVLPTERNVSGVVEVLSVNAAESYFVATAGGEAYLLRYNTADTKTVDGLVLSNAQFAAMLSAGDEIFTSYSTVAADTFEVIEDITGAATIGSAALVDVNQDGTNDRVRVSWTNPNNVSISGYVVERTTVAANGTVNTAGWAADNSFAVNSAPSGFATANASVTADAALPAAGTYTYRVRVVGSGPATPSDASAATGTVTVAAAPAAISGIAPTAFTFSDTAADSLLGSGDTVVVNFGSPIAAAAAASITLVNDLGETGVVTRGAATATFAVTGSTLTVTLLAPPEQTSGTAPFAAASTNVVQLANTAGITSAADATVLPNLRIADAVADRADLNEGLVPPPATNVSASASADTVTATVAANAFVRVYDSTGRTLLGTSPVRTTAGPITFGVAGLERNQNILVVHSLQSQSLVESLASGVTASGTVAQSASAIVQGTTYTADAAGVDGNSISVTYVVPADNATLSITVLNDAITVTAASVAGVATSTQAQVATAVNGNTAAAELVTAAGGSATPVVAEGPVLLANGANAVPATLGGGTTVGA